MGIRTRICHNRSNTDGLGATVPIWKDCINDECLICNAAKTLTTRDKRETMMTFASATKAGPRPPETLEGITRSLEITRNTPYADFA